MTKDCKTTFQEEKLKTLGVKGEWREEGKESNARNFRDRF